MCVYNIICIHVSVLVYMYVCYLYVRVCVRACVRVCVCVCARVTERARVHVTQYTQISRSYRNVISWNNLTGMSCLFILGFKVHTRGGTRAGSHKQRPSSGCRVAISLECLRHTGRACIFIYSTKWPYSVTSMNAKIREKNHRFMRMRTRT